MRVAVPFADLKNEPCEEPRLDGVRDMRRETQLLYREEVIPLAIDGEWLWVEVPGQPRFIKGKWRGYRGWMKREALARHVPPLPIEMAFLTRNSHCSDWRQQLIASGKQLVGLPYLWGGCTETHGIDCSGLAHLLYRKYGKIIPRNSSDQFLRCRQLDGHQLQPADLLFTASIPNSAKISHVLLYAGEEQLLESTLTGGCVRLISSQERFQHPLHQLRSGECYNGTYLWIGEVV